MNSNDNKLTFECQSCIKEKTGNVNIQRLVDKLDGILSTNNLEKAKNFLDRMKTEAIELGDSKALLSIYNEMVGLSRRLEDKEYAEYACSNALYMIKERKDQTEIGLATILVNIATTTSCFDNPNKALEIYELAVNIFKTNNKLVSYEYASFLNNRAMTYYDLYMYDLAYADVIKAIDILRDINGYKVLIASSKLSLAHILFERDENYQMCESLIDEAWELINDPDIKHDSKYAYEISKCVSSFRYFKREIEASALEETSKEIYERFRTI